MGQPREVTLGIICEAFNCLPSAVENEDWTTVQRIMEYRLLNSAKDQHNQDASKMSEGQINIWQEMAEALEDG